jgi:multidrug resistance efflux pump
MLGKIVFHPGTPAPEADGSYVIGEFKPDNGVPLPIAVRLVKGLSPSVRAPQTKAGAPASEARLRQIRSAQVELPYAEAELARLTKLHSSNVISDQAFSEAKYKVEELKAESKGDNAEVLRIRLQQAEENLAWLTKLHSSNVISDQAFSEAKYKVEELKAESQGDTVGVLRIRLQQAEENLARAKDLLGRSSISQEDYEQAKLKVELLRAQLAPIPVPSQSTNQEREH